MFSNDVLTIDRTPAMLLLIVGLPVVGMMPGAKVRDGVRLAVRVWDGVKVFVGDGVTVAVLVGVAVGFRLVMVYTAPSLLNELSQVGSPNTQLSEAPS